VNCTVRGTAPEVGLAVKSTGEGTDVGGGVTAGVCVGVGVGISVRVGDGVGVGIGEIPDGSTVMYPVLRILYPPDGVVVRRETE